METFRIKTELFSDEGTAKFKLTTKYKATLKKATWSEDLLDLTI